MGKRGRGNRGGGGPAEDQYGEIGGQDRGGDHHHHGSGRGGGTAGGGSRGGGGGGGGGESLTYVRQVPKFLQGYAQLLGGSNNNAARGLPADGDELDGATVVREETKKRKKFDDDDDDDGQGRDDEEEALDALDRADALAAALRENPQLAEEHPELRAAAAKALAEEEKQRGNEAMRAGDAEGAVRHYSRALAAVQASGTGTGGENAASASASASSASLSEATSVYYSNRSAAFASLKKWEEALADAGAAVRARPRWHKAHVRVGEAARGLGRPGEAAEAFARALALSPGDEGVAAALFAARGAEAKAVAERAHKFVGGSSLKRKAAGEGGGGGGGGAGGGGGEKKEAKAGRLSFAADEEEEEEEGDDDEEEEA